MLEKTSEKSSPAEPPASHLWRDASLVLAAATLWLYVMAAMFTRGYLGFFNARADWFDPSAFQLASFCALPIFLALTWTGCGIVLTFTARGMVARQRWWGSWRVWYALWALVGFVVVGFSGSFAAAVFQMGTLRATVPTLLATGALLILPRAPLRENRWLGDVSNTFKMPFPGSGPRRREAWRRRAFLTMLAVIQLLLAALLSYYLGLGTASLELWDLGNSSYRAVDANDASQTKWLLFTDGVRTLTFEGKADRGNFHYRNPETDSDLVLLWPKYAKSVRAQATSQPTSESQPATQQGS